MKRILSAFLCLLMLVPVFSGCGKAPEYSEIEGRLKELIEQSYAINEIFFGNGLPTYERVVDPRESTEVIVDNENGTRTYYYEIKDETYGRVIAYRSSYANPFTYVQVLREPDSTRTPVYEDAEKKVYAYALEGYVEPHYDFYYSSEDPENYDYITSDSPYKSIAAIKEAAEKVYSKDYLESLYQSLFDGTATQAGTTLTTSSARYYEYTDEDGITTLMQSNTYEPLVTERRIFDFTTAKIIRPKRADFVTISVESYLESKPNERVTVKLTMILQDGVWLLDSGTY